MVVELRTVISISFVLNIGEYLNHFEEIVVEHSGMNKKEIITKMALSLLHTIVFGCFL